jgi:hypothetical protein
VDLEPRVVLSGRLIEGALVSEVTEDEDRISLLRSEEIGDEVAPATPDLDIEERATPAVASTFVAEEKLHSGLLCVGVGSEFAFEDHLVQRHGFDLLSWSPAASASGRGGVADRRERVWTGAPRTPARQAADSIGRSVCISVFLSAAFAALGVGKTETLLAGGIRI